MIHYLKLETCPETDSVVLPLRFLDIELPSLRGTVGSKGVFCCFARVYTRDAAAMTEFAKFLIEFNIVISLFARMH